MEVIPASDMKNDHCAGVAEVAISAKCSEAASEQRETQNDGEEAQTHKKPGDTGGDVHCCCY